MELTQEHYRVAKIPADWTPPAFERLESAVKDAWAVSVIAIYNDEWRLGPKESSRVQSYN